MILNIYSLMFGLILSDFITQTRAVDYIDIEDSEYRNVTEELYLWSVNSTNNSCTNFFCVSDEDYIDFLITRMTTPSIYDWILIFMHITVFIAGILGNSLVCIAVYRNRSMRTVTNYFLVNLAVADLMVIIFCLPSTVIWDVTETWLLGETLCKILPYLQTVSVSVSILTLTFISIDRWYAICFPLEFKSTTKRAKKCICCIWLFSFIFDIPDLIFLQVTPSLLKIESIYLTRCERSWSVKTEKIFNFIVFAFLYFGPLLFMTYTYYQIIRVLRRSNIPGYKLSRRNKRIPLDTQGTTSTFNENHEGHLGSRRKAAKMLVVVVFIFALCYAPVHLLNILRYSINLPSNDITVACSLLAHWLCYLNSAINPVIYNFMSGKFRKEFRRSFICARPISADAGTQKISGIIQIAERSLIPTTNSNQSVNNFVKSRRSVEVIPLKSMSDCR
ncbi:orexin/Hypocretin receptor type 1-like isoform X1 [Microplitis mediator]|uniref:orexin/Hypocretin receptor type 1-like isoform X1 n=1 Tax=Microplitis mediator TaxID=375433 RepID=UPI002552EBAA|nr:orexin/Hypocretin receptor type 1-like isoform X1 [Microplitis mediator]